MALSTFHGLKLHRFDMGIGWARDINAPEDAEQALSQGNEILGGSRKIGGKPWSRTRLKARNRWIDKGRCETENGEKNPGFSFSLDFYLWKIKEQIVRCLLFPLVWFEVKIIFKNQGLGCSWSIFRQYR